MRYLLRPSGARTYGVYRSPSNGEFITRDWDEKRAFDLAREFNADIGAEFDAEKERERIQRQQNQGT